MNLNVNIEVCVICLLARNLTDEERKEYKEISWDDKEVCAFYMVRFCPHDLFVNTRSDLGVFLNQVKLFEIVF